MNTSFRVGLAWEMFRRYGEDAIRGIGEYVSRYGPWLISMNNLADFDTRKSAVEPRFDGILIGHDDFPMVHTIRWPTSIPVVAVHRMFDDVAPWRVQPDNVRVGRLVAQEFSRRGFRNFAFCQSFSMPTPNWDHDRIKGFSTIARRSGAEPSIYAGSPGGELRYGEKHAPVFDWLRSLPKPVGIFGADDMCARQLLHAAEAIGARVPEEIAIIGVNNEAWTEVLYGGVSSVELDGFRAGYVAAELLHRLMLKHSVRPGVTVIPPRRIIVRHSSSTVAISDPDVVMAVRFIAEHATEGLTVEQVVDAVPLSRRTLERRFRQAVGQSILDHIRRAQVERCRRLLADPDIPLSKVARVSGFTSIKAMNAIFSRVAHMTPLAYRQSMQQGRPPA